MRAQGAGVLTAWLPLLLLPVFLQAQDLGAPASPQLELRKTAKTREYRGKPVEGEERIVRPGETLWGILIEEKGLSEKRFGQYQSVVEILNPQLKESGVLRSGETIFVPFRLDELLGVEVSAEEEVRIYRVRPGDTAYKILRRELPLQTRDAIQAAFEKLKQLNPGKKDWNLLLVGEALRFPGRASSPVAGEKGREATAAGTAPPEKPPASIAETRWAILEQVANSLGGTFSRAGEEVFELQDGKITLDRALFPVISDRRLGRRVVVDARDAIPAGLKARIQAEAHDASILTVKPDAGAADLNAGILAQLGYQILPANRPLVFRDRGIGLELKGDWMVMQPDTVGARETIWIFLLTKAPEPMPDSLDHYLESKGVKLAQITLSSSDSRNARLARTSAPAGAAEKFPDERTALVDSLLRSYPVEFVRDRNVSVSLREGIRLQMKIDRYWEAAGAKRAFVFGRLSSEMKKAVEETAGLELFDLDLRGQSTREIVGRVLQALGESAAYTENRFAAGEGRLGDSVVLTVRGFLVRSRSLLVTDRVLPPDVERFILNQGVRIAYFR
ncbi:MAG TPA: LysM peptidoglycan-binding domain-containing protein [Candidatus Acidoferrales bacterium]|nr:LysM peptidoglycan-binding domain-containing protein [Candidatus Acidoferrales bacterium]